LLKLKDLKSDARTGVFGLISFFLALSVLSLSNIFSFFLSRVGEGEERGGGHKKRKKRGMGWVRGGHHVEVVSVLTIIPGSHGAAQCQNPSQLLCIYTVQPFIFESEFSSLALTATGTGTAGCDFSPPLFLELFCFLPFLCLRKRDDRLCFLCLNFCGVHLLLFALAPRDPLLFLSFRLLFLIPSYLESFLIPSTSFLFSLLLLFDSAHVCALSIIQTMVLKFPHRGRWKLLYQLKQPEAFHFVFSILKIGSAAESLMRLFAILHANRSSQHELRKSGE
jgi:hypothetical protein